VHRRSVCCISISREIEVHVIAPEERPMERILGPQMGDFVRSLHEEHGVIFHLGETASAITGRQVTLKGGGMLEADLGVVGIGVRPRINLAGRAGLTVDRGVVVNAYLETSVPGIFAAGDVARWPDPHSGESIRVEHWVVAERQGQTAARNMIGYGEKFSDVPFFWSQHYDIPINYAGHAEKWELAIEGEIPSKDCLLRFKRNGRVTAVASIFCDAENFASRTVHGEGHRSLTAGSARIWDYILTRRKMPKAFILVSLIGNSTDLDEDFGSSAGIGSIQNSLGGTRDEILSILKASDQRRHEIEALPKAG
jgi:hypothetical protein